MVDIINIIRFIEDFNKPFPFSMNYFKEISDALDSGMKFIEEGPRTLFLSPKIIFVDENNNPVLNIDQNADENCT